MEDGFFPGSKSKFLSERRSHTEASQGLVFFMTINLQLIRLKTSQGSPELGLENKYMGKL